MAYHSGRAALFGAGLALASVSCDGDLPSGELGVDRLAVEESTSDAATAYPIWHEPGPHQGPHILTCYGGCAPPHYDATACGGSTACCSNCIDGTWWYSTEQRNFGCGAKLEISRDGRCVVVEVADNGPGDWVETNAAARCGGSGWIIDTSPLVADYFGGGCGYGECFWVNVRQVDSSLPQGPCPSCPCDGPAPTPESCNGQDDDQDGAVDEGLVRGCTAGIGACAPGTETCANGAWGACVGNTGPTSESCNGEDDDCDGTVDEGLSQVCGSDVGVCVSGVQTCSGGSWGACAGSIGPSSESCNALDDDCDGGVDEDLARSCGTDVGLCVSGVETCSGGAWSTCVGEVPPTSETCSNEDEDCDGLVDEEDVCELEEITHQAGAMGYDLSSDVDGDGRADACARTAAGLTCLRASGHDFDTAIVGPELSDARGFADPAYFGTLRTGDVDGDGRADVCIRAAEGIRCWRSTGTSFGPQLLGPRLSDAAGWNEPRYWSTLRLADIDGDRRADLCARAPDGLRCWRSVSAPLDTQTEPLAALSDAAGFAAVQRFGTIRMADLDGDGRTDVCARLAEAMTCWLATGTGFGPAVAGPAWSDGAGWMALDRWSTIRLGDVNGDGHADLCARNAAGWECYLWSNGSFRQVPPIAALADDAGFTDRARYASLREGDLDGDGDHDLCALTDAGIVCWLWTGMDFGQRITGPALTPEAGWDRPARYRTLRMADVNADGRDDLCGRTAGGLRCWLSDEADFRRTLLGRGWGDAPEWDLAASYTTVRLAGGRRSSEGDHGPPELQGGCGVATPSDGAPPRALLVVVALLIAATARPRRS